MESFEALIGTADLSDHISEALLDLQEGMLPIKQMTIGWYTDLCAGGIPPDAAAHAAMTVHGNLVQMVMMSALNRALAKSKQESKPRRFWGLSTLAGRPK